MPYACYSACLPILLQRSARRMHGYILPNNIQRTCGSCVYTTKGEAGKPGPPPSRCILYLSGHCACACRGCLLAVPCLPLGCRARSVAPACLPAACLPRQVVGILVALARAAGSTCTASGQAGCAAQRPGAWRATHVRAATGWRYSSRAGSARTAKSAAARRACHGQRHATVARRATPRLARRVRERHWPATARVEVTAVT